MLELLEDSNFILALADSGVVAIGDNKSLWNLSDFGLVGGQTIFLTDEGRLLVKGDEGCFLSSSRFEVIEDNERDDGTPFPVDPSPSLFWASFSDLKEEGLIMFSKFVSFPSTLSFWSSKRLKSTLRGKYLDIFYDKKNSYLA